MPSPGRDVGLIDRYREFLPVTDATPVVTLGEGGTPLVALPRLSERLGVDVRVKLEGANPTGSFKDRGMTLALSKAVESGATGVICASTGNTSASAAAYSARAGLRCVVLIPDGKIAAGKLAQAIMHGARVIAIEGGFDDALRVTRDLVERHPIELVNSINPYRLEGQKTAAFEVCDALGEAPDVLCIPVGNAANISSYWLGFQAYREASRSRVLPRLFGFQAAGAAPLITGRVVPVARPETVATAIRIGDPVRGVQALESIAASDGVIDAVTDEEILSAYHLLAATEGVFCEPASAASVAGLLKQCAAGAIRAGVTVVCVLTGHGLKDPDTAIGSGDRVVRLAADVDVVEEAAFA